MGQLKLDGIEIINLFNKDGEQTLALTGDQGLTVSGKITFPDNKAAEWPNGSIRAEGNTLKLVATTLIDLQDTTQIQGKLNVNTTSNASSAPLHVGNANGGNWNDGIVIDDASGWAATVYKRSNSPKMFTGLYSGSDNYIMMSPLYSNTSTGISAPRTDAVMQILPGNDTVEHYLPNYFGREMTIQANNTGDPVVLTLYNIANGSGAGIRFSDQSNSAQKGHLYFYHADGSSYGSGTTFVLGSSESTTTILADGKLMYNEGIYKKPASGTGAGTRKDSNWDTAYGWGNHASVGYAMANVTIGQARNLDAVDDRDMAPEDLSYSDDLRIFFSAREGLEDGTSTGSDWHDVLVLNSYSDSSGGNANVLAFDKNSYKIRHYQAGLSASNWGDAKVLAYTSDIPTNNNQLSNGAGYLTSSST